MERPLEAQRRCAHFSPTLDASDRARHHHALWLITTVHAAKGGKLKVLQWLRAQGCPWDKDVTIVAAFNGNRDMLRWARENGCPWDKRTQSWAAQGLKYTDDLGNVVP